MNALSNYLVNQIFKVMTAIIILNKQCFLAKTNFILSNEYYRLLYKFSNKLKISATKLIKSALYRRCMYLIGF